uniref:NADH-ubiquinone oxidoreductase chain 4 n=1 Tax=Dasya binghamiae TaxID=1896963 RepID=A0A1C8XRT6_9FLOR|nr:NADH dehydrogenase subunit 4 [Dasya binghamiae]AOH77196.1 NADH dehydrogenase subunit 4 [Dasya binghamiae]
MFLNFIFSIINPLIVISLIPLIGIFVLFFINEYNKIILYKVSLIFTSFTFIFSTLLWILFYSKTAFFQFSTTLIWVPYFNFNYILGIDGISLFFVLLTTFLINVCVLSSWYSVTYLVKEYLICFLFLEFCLIQVFCVLDLLLFYIFFESVLIPMFLIIGIWGSRSRKIRAAYQFFLYTLIGSFFMLIGLIYIYTLIGTTDLQVLWFTPFSELDQLYLWIAFFLSFAVKIPMVPFHIWLPEAHAEAPTAGSVILAGVLLKLGGYGFLRFSLPLFPQATIYYAPFIFTLSLIAVVYGSLTTLRQIDLKKIIAYSSISHMGFVTLGIFSLNMQGIEGSIILMLGHGLVSSALFLCVGVLYDRYKTRILKYYGGLVTVMPIFIIFFMFFSFANIGFPGTSNFVGEFLILLGIFQINFFITFFSMTGVILSAAYSVWLLNRLGFSLLRTNYFDIFQDISRREFAILFILVILILWVGIYPNSFLNELHFSVLNLLEQFF